MICPNGHSSSATDYCDTCGEAMGAAAGAAPAGDSGAVGGNSPGSSAATQPCPNCGVPNQPDALFCENCGYDHTTGTMPRPAESVLDLAAAQATSEGMPSASVGSSPPDASGSAAQAAGSVGDSSASPASTDGGGSGAPAGPAGAAGVAGSAPSSAPVLDPPWVAEVWIDPQWYAGQESPDPLPSPGLPAVVPLRHTSLLVGRVSVSRGITPDIDCGADNGVSRRHAQLTTDGQRWWVEDLASSNGTFIGQATAPPPNTPIPVGAKREVASDDRIYVGSWTRIVLRPAAEGEA